MAFPRSDPLELLTSSGVPLDRPFSTAGAHAAGLDDRRLHRLVRAGLLTRPLRGVYLAVDVPDTSAVRLACVREVMPPGCVVTDRTAAWLHGASMALAPGAHLETPKISAFHRPHRRLVNGLTDSGARGLAAYDVMDMDGVPVTTPLRTACDLGRLLRRDGAFAALDAMLRLGSFEHEQLLEAVERFKGYRGVRQLRAFAPLADPGSESFGESALRLRWYDAGIAARPRTQVVVVRRSGQVARLDIGDEKHRFAVEYDGEEFHGPDRAEHDARRRRWIAEELGWFVGVYRRADVFGRHQSATDRMGSEFLRAKLQFQRASTV